MKKKKPQRVDVVLCLDLISRVITSNVKDRLERARMRNQFLENMSTLNQVPVDHAGGILRLIAKYGRNFENGIHLGFTLALVSRTTLGKAYIKRLIEDVESAQNNQPPEIHPASGAV